MGRVLVVDDDETIGDVVRRYLERAGLAVEVVTDGSEALARALAEPPDAVVLDLMLPGLSGLEVCRRLRAAGSAGSAGSAAPAGSAGSAAPAGSAGSAAPAGSAGSAGWIPIVMLTALGEESDRVLGLELGADDYVTKPFSPRELALRVQSVLRRSREQVPPAERAAVLRDGDLVVDVAGRRATAGGRPLLLTVREFDLLAFLVAHPGRAFTRAELLERVWGWTFGDQSTVTVHVRRLREKLEPGAAAPRVATVWGVGYRYDPVAGP